MAQGSGNFILPDNPEINPNPQNLASALIVIGWTARNFITHGGPISQGPTVPEHRANLEHRLSDGASLAYMPYRPYVPFTPSSLCEGQHSSHTQRRPLHSNQSSDLTFTDSLYCPAGSPSRATTPFNPPSSPIAVSPVTTTHPDTLPATTVTSIAPNPIVTQHNKDFMDDEPPFPTNDSTVMDQDMSTAQPSPAHSTVMDQDVSTAPPLPLVNPPSHPPPAHHLPADTSP
ncbi:uncharacterized protein F5147DRAFT_769784 [Suillus discolor]|uniref:Uncharacterized protein n=1 Tax=Suillus discolor TaxID=1912936 RepID=A0A9P7JY47_9AGAM|nr:uncharacterized protein F5147DRAFT_769784 [Suillus discolor]KAG2115324.1 hypothetical protein F5147DRAFT_769784 [Suillus discolor]